VNDILELMKKTKKEANKKAIIVEHLTKNFTTVEKEKGLWGSIKSIIAPQKKNIQALKKISFSIDEGELVGFIGPNGAGKTTTLKILSGLLYPSAGFVQVLGHDPWHRKPEYLKNISLVMGQKNQLWWDLPAEDAFELNKEIFEISDRQYKQNLDELVSILDVGKILKTPIRKLSLGQRMRLELVSSLLHRPKILFLDEPTLGLDLIAQQKMRDFIYEYNKKFGATIMLTSHNMSDLVNLAKRVIVIAKGEIIFDGDLTELVDNYAEHKTIKLRLAKETNLKELEKIGKVTKVDFPQVVMAIPREVAAVASAEILQNFPIADLNVEEESVEEIIRKVFKGKILKMTKK